MTDDLKQAEEELRKAQEKLAEAQKKAQQTQQKAQAGVKPKPKAKKKKGTLAIDVQGLRFSYGNLEILKGFDLKVAQGETLGFVGPNGAGKTTSFSVIAGFLMPNKGEVKVLGHSPWDTANLKGKLSVLPQDAQLIANVGIHGQLVFFAELLGYSGKEADEEALRVLELVGLADHVKKFPGHLSHGMAKRTGLAQAFIGSPDVVLLDEPTAGLDPFAAKQIRDLIASMRGERTVVVSSHNLAEIQDICTDVALIHQGQIIKHGDIDSFTEKDNQLRVQIRGGVPPVPFFQSIETSGGVRDVQYEPHLGWMTVNLLPDAPPADEVIKMIVGKVFELGLSLGEIQRGTSLEDVFMQLTGHPGQAGPAGYGPPGGYGSHGPPGGYGGRGGPPR